MIVLDTNVISEPLRPEPDPQVVAWLDKQHVETLCLTAITLAELRYGIAALPEGRRKRVLSDRLETETLPLFAGRILPFDDAASRTYARLQSSARTVGTPMSAMDGLIAAICATHRCALATRNTADFRSTGLTVIDPWAPRD